MKLNRQTAVLVLGALLIVFTLTGCGRDSDQADTQPTLKKIEYTNLSDNVSRQLLENLLSSADVSENRIQGFFSRVEQFNDSVKAGWLTDGFEEADPLDTKYDPYEMQDAWTARNGAFPGYNCRITAMELFGEFVSVGDDAEVDADEEVLFVDEITLKTDRCAVRKQSGRFPRTVFLYESGKHHRHSASCSDCAGGMESQMC